MALHDHTPAERRDLKQIAKQRPSTPAPKAGSKGKSRPKRNKLRL